MVLEGVCRAIGGVWWLLGRIVFGPPKKKPNDKRPNRLEDKENVAPQSIYSSGMEKPTEMASVPQCDNSLKVGDKDRSRSKSPSGLNSVDHGLSNGVPEQQSALAEPLREIQNEIDATFKESLVAMGLSTTPPPNESSSERTFSHQVTSLEDGSAEVTEETLKESSGESQLYSHRRHEVEERRTSPFGGGGGEGAGGCTGGVVESTKDEHQNMFQVKKFETWNPPTTQDAAAGYQALNGTEIAKESYSSQTMVSSSSFSSSISSTQQQQQQVMRSMEAPVIPVAPPPPPPPSDKQRPMSMPSLDFNILDAIETNKITMVGGESKTQQSKQTTKTTSMTTARTYASSTTKDGHSRAHTSDEESRRFQMLMKAFQPAPEEEGLLAAKKKMFSSSSFYDEPKHIYPTVQEQVKLCKSIADSLSADTNSTSRGATMYIKRMNRSTTWITEGPDPTSSESGDVDSSEYEPTTPEVKPPDFVPQLRLVLDPRQLQDAMKLSKTGIYNEHNVVSPDICFDLVRDLNSPTGKGAQLFAKRKKKSEKWIVDEDSVKEAVKDAAAKYVAMSDVVHAQQQHPMTPFGNTMPIAAPRNVPASQLQELQNRLNPSVKLIKSPWEAALASPSGCIEAAFQVVNKKKVNPPVAQPPPPPMSNAPADMRLYSPRPFSPAPGFFQAQPPATTARSSSPYYPSNNAVYKAKTPKGWIGNTNDQSMYAPSWGGHESPSLMDTSFSSDLAAQAPSPTSFQRYQLDNFPNYNNVARAWGHPQQQRTVKGVRSVRPSSTVYGQ